MVYPTETNSSSTPVNFPTSTITPNDPAKAAQRKYAEERKKQIQTEKAAKERVLALIAEDKLARQEKKAPVKPSTCRELPSDIAFDRAIRVEAQQHALKLSTTRQKRKGKQNAKRSAKAEKRQYDEQKTVQDTLEAKEKFLARLEHGSEMADSAEQDDVSNTEEETEARTAVQANVLKIEEEIEAKAADRPTGRKNARREKKARKAAAKAGN